jgi:hypothetical protein
MKIAEWVSFVHLFFGNSRIATLLMQENYSPSFPLATTWQLCLPILHEPRVWILAVIYDTTDSHPRLSQDQQLFCSVFVPEHVIVFATGIERKKLPSLSDGILDFLSARRIRDSSADNFLIEFFTNIISNRSLSRFNR